MFDSKDLICHVLPGAQCPREALGSGVAVICTLLLPVLDSRWFLLSRSTAGSLLGSMCKCGRRTSSWVRLTPEVHGCDKTGVQREYVENLAV